ncbi:hypothetical protein ACJJVG_08825 [Pseudocitrobacter faecalis]|uniref:hypothetical protein n=1 Tax=Pseudocitrobacter faecalis TaxID=1398493 RepID=UPI00389AD37F
MHSFHHIMSLLDEQALHNKYKVHQQTQAELDKAERKLNDLLSQKEYYCSEIRCEAMKQGQFENVIEKLVDACFAAKFPAMQSDIQNLTERLNNAASQNHIY